MERTIRTMNLNDITRNTMSTAGNAKEECQKPKSMRESAREVNLLISMSVNIDIVAQYFRGNQCLEFALFQYLNFQYFSTTIA